MTTKRMPRNVDKAIAYVMDRPTVAERISGLQLLALKTFPGGQVQRRIMAILDEQYAETKGQVSCNP